MTDKIVVSSTETRTVQLSDEEEAARNASKVAWDNAAPERAMAELRKERNAKLAASDWMAMSDYTMSDPWKTYRQALRDLPANTADPANPIWPEEPS
jgi:hypothetical protein